MNSTFARITCRILVASMIALPWHAQAGMIGTDVAVRGPVIDRGAIALQLEALGVSPQAARERVAALTDAEVADLAGRIDALPAGGISGVLPIVVVVILIWWFTAGEKAHAESSKGKTAPSKPAPAPEKK
jgi:hypothetical protein